MFYINSDEDYARNLADVERSLITQLNVSFGAGIGILFMSMIFGPIPYEGRPIKWHNPIEWFPLLICAGLWAAYYWRSKTLRHKLSVAWQKYYEELPKEKRHEAFEQQYKIDKEQRLRR